mgnify:CR=1 FL=1
MAEETKPLQKKNPFITLQAKCFLTDSGENFFTKKQIPLRDMIGPDGRKRYGFTTLNFHAYLVQKLIVKRMISDIFVAKPTLLEKRTEIMDVTKLVIYGILYKKFGPQLSKVLVSTELMEKYNKKNPTKKITLNSKFNYDAISKLIEIKKEEIIGLKKLMLARPISMIDTDQEIRPEDKLEKKLIVTKFVEMIDKQSWYMFYLISQTDERQAIIKHVEKQLIDYLEKTKIADYFALMLMEIIQNAEKAHLEKIARQKNMLKPTDSIDSFLRDKGCRDMVVVQAKKWDHNLNLFWRFENPNIALEDEEYKLQVQVVNKGVVGQKKKKSMQNKIKAEVKESSLANFYEHGGAEKLGAGLGLFYLSYIDEACKNFNIKFESRIITDEKKEETIVHMGLKFV